MKDIKELIYAAVEENAVAFQELAGSILQARAYDAIEAMRPEVGASMFGEAKECSDEEDEDGKKSRKSKESDDDDSMEDVEEALVGKQHKIDKNKNGKIDSHDFKLLRKEEVEQIDEVDHPKNQADMLAHIMHQIKTTGHPVATDAQFRASHGKDESKIASLEPPKDKMQYAIAQGGNVKP